MAKDDKESNYTVHGFNKYSSGLVKTLVVSCGCPVVKGQGKPNKMPVSADTANDTDLIQKQLKLHGLHEL